MFTTPCYIRKNTPELRDRLKELGYHVCVCTEFEGAVWLNNLLESSSIHGWGFLGDDAPFKTQEEALRVFEIESKDKKIDCGTNEDLFLALAALRDDSDYMNWFRDYNGGHWMLCTEKVYRGSREWHTEHAKATAKAKAEELLNLITENGTLWQ